VLVRLCSLFGYTATNFKRIFFRGQIRFGIQRVQTGAPLFTISSAFYRNSPKDCLKAALMKPDIFSFNSVCAFNWLIALPWAPGLLVIGKQFAHQSPTHLFKLTFDLTVGHRMNLLTAKATDNIFKLLSGLLI
jgi:hypothetical protein